MAENSPPEPEDFTEPSDVTVEDLAEIINRVDVSPLLKQLAREALILMFSAERQGDGSDQAISALPGVATTESGSASIAE